MEATINKRPFPWVLIILVGLFLVPIFLAYAVYQKGGPWLETSNSGNLINPPLHVKHLQLTDVDGSKLSFKPFHGKWLMMYVNPEYCSEACIKDIYHVRQIRAALGKNINRVQRLVVTPYDKRDPAFSNIIAESFPGMQQAKVTETQQKNLKTYLAGSDNMQHALYLVDPRGFIMMSYPAGFPPRELLIDMRRLLKVSQVG